MNTPAHGAQNPTVDMLEHVDWAVRIARNTARNYQFRRRSQEESDLESVATLVLVQHAGRFSSWDSQRYGGGIDTAEGLTKAFRGWCYQTLLTELRREARRLRNGGTYNTRREIEGKAVVVNSLEERRFADGELQEIVDHRCSEAEMYLSIM